jgi:hypothetical protein
VSRNPKSATFASVGARSCLLPLWATEHRLEISEVPSFGSTPPATTRRHRRVYVLGCRCPCEIRLGHGPVEAREAALPRSREIELVSMTFSFRLPGWVPGPQFLPGEATFRKAKHPVRAERGTDHGNCEGVEGHGNHPPAFTTGPTIRTSMQSKRSSPSSRPAPQVRGTNRRSELEAHRANSRQPSHRMSSPITSETPNMFGSKWIRFQQVIDESRGSAARNK